MWETQRPGLKTTKNEQNNDKVTFFHDDLLNLLQRYIIKGTLQYKVL